MKVSLINPPGGYYASRWEESALPSLGLGYLASYLEQHGIACEIVDAHAMRWRLSDLSHHLAESAPDLVGVTFTTENRFESFEAIRTARAVLPESLLIAGGPHVSAAAEDTLAHVPELDMVVRGEGEATLLDIVRHLQNGRPFDEIKGISRRVGSQIEHNAPRPHIQDLDTLPFPARHLMPMERYQFAADVPGVGKLRAQNIMASRGCPFNCSFCASPNMWGRKFRARTTENVMAEIDELVMIYGAQALWIFDDTFTVDKKRTAAICEEIARKYPSLRWFCEIRVDTVDRELLGLMKRAGCFCVAFGVESGSQRIIDHSIGKQIKLEEVAQVRSWCKELDLLYNPFMILSHPDETDDDARKSMDLIRQCKADGASVSLAIMHIYPGTRIETIAYEKGILPRDFSWARKSDLRRVQMLPAAQGNVPVFLDQLSWEFLSSCMFEWAEMQNYSVLRRVPKALANIRSMSDVKRYWTMLKSYVGREKSCA